MAMVGNRSPAASICSTARSERGSASTSRAGNSRRSFSTTRICWAPSITWLLVTTTPSARRMTPEPTDSATRARGAPPPNSSQNGSRWRTSERAEMLTTAGAAVRTTGAKDTFMVFASLGAVRVGWAMSSGTSWALVFWGLPQAATNRAATRARRDGFIVSRRSCWASLRTSDIWDGIMASAAVQATLLAAPGSASVQGRAQALQLIAPPAGLVPQEHRRREAVPGDVLDRDGVPAAVLDADPGLVPYRLEADLDLGVLLRGEAGAAPAEHQTLARRPDADVADHEHLAAGQGLDEPAPRAAP